MTLAEGIHRLPKTDLHCHLDGSLRLATMFDIARQKGIDLDARNLEELKSRLNLGRPAKSLEAFIDYFQLTCSVMQWPDALTRIAFELAEDAAHENVRYVEVRFAPTLHTNEGFSLEEVVRAVAKGLKDAESQFEIRTGLILCALRNLEPSVSMEAAKLAVTMKEEGVVGFDLANPERGNVASRHAEAALTAKKGGLHITIHAGEDDGPESIRQALDRCGAERIGHGRTLFEDSELEKRVIREGIPLEICPSSNVQVGLIENFSAHPLKGYLQRGVRVTLNTDNRLLTDITVSDEYERAAEHLGFGWPELSAIALNGFRSTFLPENEREALAKEAEKQIAAIATKLPPNP